MWHSRLMLGWCFGVWVFLRFTYTYAVSEQVYLYIYIGAYTGKTSYSKNVNFLENKGVEKLMLVNTA